MDQPITFKNSSLIVETVLLAGKLLMENGAETSRVEDTMERMMRKALCYSRSSSSYTYVTVNGIFVKAESGEAYFERIDGRTFHLQHICSINQLSRDYVDGRMELVDIHRELLRVAKEQPKLALWKRLCWTACLSGSVMLIFGRVYQDVPAAMAAGIMAYLCYLFLSRALKVPFLAEYGSAFLGGAVGCLMYMLIGVHLNLIMMGAVIPLVPGIAITNAIRDMMARHYLSGLMGAIEAICIAGALGAGIACVSLPIVPGITFYEAFRGLVTGNNGAAAVVFLQVAYGAAGIACGMIIAEVLYRHTIRRILHHCAR